jgi:hypothetical protein
MAKFKVGDRVRRVKGVLSHTVESIPLGTVCKVTKLLGVAVPEWGERYSHNLGGAWVIVDADFELVSPKTFTNK